MKKIVTVLLASMLIFACSSKKDGNMIVQGNIKGLKKGTLYLQKMNDTLLVSVDSVNVFGDGNFKLTDNVESPVMYYLAFDSKTTDKRILFLVIKELLQLMIILIFLDSTQRLQVLKIKKF